MKRADHVKEILAEMVLVGLTLADSRDHMPSLLLMLAKLQNKRVLKDDSLIRAKLAAKIVQLTGDLDFAIWHVLLAIEMNDRAFFVDFGKCLSGEIKDSTLFDKRQRDIAEIVVSHPEMSAKEAVRELQKRNHRGITEENFRMWKMRLLKAKRNFDAILAQQRT